MIKEDALKALETINASGNLEWLMLELDEETGRALVVSKDCVAKMPFNVEWAKITWEECTLRKWLNGEFFDSLPETVRTKIPEVELVNRDSCTIPGGNNTTDHIFLLSVDHYNAMPDEWKASSWNGAGCWYWLRTPGYDSYNYANVNRCGGLDGGLDANGKYVGHGYHVDSDSGCVRPACYIDLD
ncbi:MAG: hypothetical protein IKG70_02055 [Lachnospiraceae bacterium]|nr:hypothetical protein [Lachnospiraceae bacterium]